MKDKYYKTLKASIEDALELWIEGVNEEEFSQGSSKDGELIQFMELVKILYDSRMPKSE